MGKLETRYERTSTLSQTYYQPVLMNYQPPVFNNSIPTISIIRPAEEKKPEPIHYTFIDGDVLEHIATSQNTTVQRLFDKNTSITNPDDIKTGETIEIPSADETLTHRDMPSNIEPIAVRQISPPISGGFSNPYEYGWCVWFAADQRRDLHIVDNASGWIKYANSSAPRVGAVAVNTWAAGGLGHVGIVIDFNSTQVLVRSMNFPVFGNVTTDWVDIGYWAGYIL